MFLPEILFEGHWIRAFSCLAGTTSKKHGKMLTNSISTGMADLFKTGQLTVNSDEEILLDLECTNGQPLHSRLSKFTVRGESTLISRFKGNVQGHSIGKPADVRKRTVRIFCTFHDYRDLLSDQPPRNIKLRIRLSCGDSRAEHVFNYKAQATGEIITCVYEIAVN